MRTLNVISGPGSGQRIEVDRELVIGRENADLTIEDAELSRRHAVVRPLERGVEIEDLGSMNGTFVNGQRIEDPVAITVNSEVKLGTSQIVVELALPAVTKATDLPGAQRTRAAGTPIVDDPELTRARPVARPATPTPQEQPPVAPEYDVTAQRGVPAPPAPQEQQPAAPQPDVTAQRPTGAPPPPGPPAPPTEEEPPAPAAPGPPGPPWGAGKPPWGDGPPPWGEGPPPWGPGPPPWAKKGKPPPKWLLEGKRPPLHIRLAFKAMKAGYPVVLGVAVILVAAIVALIVFLGT